MPHALPLSRSIYAGKLAEYSHIAFSGVNAGQYRGQWSALFRERMGAGFSGRLILEIGCFNAGFLSGIAAENPATAFIGIDWKCKAIYDGAANISSQKLKNIVLLRARANEPGEIFAAGELDEIWIFHPDPCDKPHELKNRLVSRRFLIEAAALLRDDNSLLTLKTDHRDYYQSVLDLFGATELASGVKRVRSSDGYWTDSAALQSTSHRLFAGKSTLFERRFVQRRKPIYYIDLCRG